MPLSQSDLQQIKLQIRQTVDPMFIRLRTDLFGAVYNKELQGSVIPTSIVIQAVEDGIDNAIGGGSVTPATVRYTAGTSGVQTGKVVYFDGSVVHHADATQISHAGKVVGIASEVGAPGELVNIQMYGILDLPGIFTFSPVSPLVLGVNGELTSTPVAGSVFLQAVGISTSISGMFVYVSPTLYML